jgi:hypothetical protein
MDGFLLERGDLDSCAFAEDGGLSGRIKGGMALASSPALNKLGGLLRPMLLIGLDPVLMLLFFSSIGERRVCLVVAAITVYSSTTVYIILVFYCLYAY